MSPHPRHKPGFVLISALFLVMLASLIIMAVSQGFAAQTSRTRLQAQQTQLEQVLLAGRDIALAGNKNPDLTPSLPKDLQHAGYRLTQSQNTLTATAGQQTKSLTLQ